MGWGCAIEKGDAMWEEATMRNEHAMGSMGATCLAYPQSPTYSRARIMFIIYLSAGTKWRRAACGISLHSVARPADGKTLVLPRTSHLPRRIFFKLYEIPRSSSLSTNYQPVSLLAIIGA